MKRLHHDDGPARDASHFRQDAGRVLRVREHEDEQRGGVRTRFERKDSVRDQDGRRSNDVNVAHVGSDHLESQLLFQSGGEVSGPGAEVQHGSVGRQPCAHLLHQLTRSPFHDAVEYRLQHSIASSNPATVLGSYPVSTSSSVSRRIFGQNPRSRSLG